MATLLADSAAPGPTPPLAAQWKKIDALLAKDQTATAAPLVEKIYQQARREGNTAAHVRALLYKVRLLENRENDADERAIALLEADLQTATFPARPILHSLLAELYTNYFNAHRYQFYERTQGAAPTSDPATPGAADGGTGLATWDARRLGAAIVRHYEASVKDEPQRQLQTTLATLGDLTTRGNAEGRALRPTLYDLLAQRAIAGLQNQELTVTEPEQQFQPRDPRLFARALEFAALSLTAPADDSLNHALHALRLLQQLTAQRLRQPQQLAALAAIDLQRLDYLHSLTRYTELDSAYATALTQFAEQYKALPISTEFVARAARLAQESSENGGPASGLLTALALAKEAEARFPDSRGAAQAWQLRAAIEQAEVSFSAAEVVVPGQPWRLDIRARNVTELHAWAYRVSLKEWEKAGGYEDERSLPKRYARALRAAPVATWSVPVPAYLFKYKPQQFAAAGPALPIGYYLVLLSNRTPLSTNAAATSAQPGTVTAYARLGASELSAVSQADGPSRQTRLLVLHRQSGQPLGGVQVRPGYSEYRNGRETTRLGSSLVTDALGRVALPAPSGSNERLGSAYLTRGRDTLITRDFNGYYQPRPGRELRQRTFLFSDRAIYRPGQTLYFKGIMTQTYGSESKLLTGQPVNVELLDANGQPVQSLSFTSSDYGSFNGSLVLPTGRLNGEYRLRTNDGELAFAVEDYKRPTFQVQLDSVPGRPQLGQPLTLTGRAQAYAGQATDGAKVQYRVRRELLWPLYGGYGRRGPYPPGLRNNREIAHGTTTTDANGRFSLSFMPPAEAYQGRRGWRPGYLFEITTDVTDAAGETRSTTRRIVVGDNPLSLSLNGPSEIDQRHLPAFILLSANATGEPLPATGTLRLLARRFRPSPPGVPGPAPDPDEDELPGQLIKTQPFDTKKGPGLDVAALLAGVPTGRYRLEARAARPDSAQVQLDFTLYDSASNAVPFATPDWFVALTDSVAPGQPVSILLGSNEADTRVLLETERGGQPLRQEWLTLRAGEQRRLVLDSGPATALGPLYVHTTQVRDNRLYRHSAAVQVAERAQPLQLSISTFRDRLRPGQRETWRVTIHQASGKPAMAELLATLYDQSLDVFRLHRFEHLQLGGGYYPALLGWQGGFAQATSAQALPAGELGKEVPDADYPMLNKWLNHLNVQEVVENKLATPMVGRAIRIRGLSTAAAEPAPAPMPDETALSQTVTVGYGTPRGQATPPDLSRVAARTDFRETAFWQPALHTDAHGDVVLEFQMPEAVTRWQLLALAHDKSLHSGQLARQLVTQKEIQITPNAPRFLRPGDAFTFPAKLSNLTDHAVSGTAQLFLLDAATGQDITAQLLSGPAQQPVSAAAHQSQALGWELRLPADFAPVAVTYRVVAQAGGQPQAPEAKSTSKRKNRQAALASEEGPGATFTDGEENTLPVLPNRVLITESLPLPVLGPGTHEFELKKLTSTSSPTRRHQSLTLEMTANPAWYAVQSLPYLMEYPYECSEQTFSRLYANLLAAKILKDNPRIKLLLAEWQRQAQSGTAAQQNALASKLAQNQDLKNLLLQETPWVRDAQSETERLARLSALFDETRLRSETTRALTKLRAMQLPSGAWPWFERMPADRYITQLLVAGFGKLKTLGAFDASQDEAARPLLQAALGYLDRQLASDYAQLRRQKSVQLASNHLADEQVQALYARSFWPQPAAVGSAQVAYTYYQGQAAQHWAGRTRYLQAQLALALHRQQAKSNAAALILRALTENALHSPELGMYWQDVRPGYYWRQAPTETQATLIEAFSEVKNDQRAIEEMKIWLLKQKQTHSWESTRATADACYALLLRGADRLAPTQPLQIRVGGEAVQPSATQAGTGYFRTTWPAAEVKPAQGRVSISKPEAGVAWGALYWQYFEDIDKVTSAATPLSLERQLYREVRTATGPALEQLTATAPLRVGEAVVVRLVLRTDRALEYVHLKDQRAAGLELINQVSSYQYQGGLGYYESPRDAATNFFISELPRGTHVFEYRLRASQAGDFAGGLCQVQCLYAPEFGAHSAGQRLRIAVQ